MEFMNRGAQANARPMASHGGEGPVHHKANQWDHPGWLRILLVSLLFAATALTVLLLFLMYFGNSKESDYVDTKKQQAVFLTNGQVYFGKIKSISKQYLDLRGIYYLNVNQQVQPNQKDQQQAANVTLVKLGCELHGPIDQMLVNRDQVTFWENLKDDGQVTTAIAKWVSDNPDGQKCAQPSSSTTTTPTTKP